MERIRGHLTAVSAAVLAELDTINDPVARQDAAREVNETLLPVLVAEVKMHRARTVGVLRDGRTLSQVGKLIGGKSAARVDQILKGK